MSSGVLEPVSCHDHPAIARFTVAQYEQMITTGILGPSDRVELLEGYVVLKLTHSPEHDGTIDLILDRLRGILPGEWRRRVQQSIRLADSQPDPDIAMVRGGNRRYLQEHPRPADIGLLIEVANSSLMRYIEDKARIYARAAIPTYWVINLTDRLIEVMSQPSGPCDAPAFALRRTVRPADALDLVLDGQTLATIPVTDLLP